MARLKQIGVDVEVNGVIESHRRSFSEAPNDILRRLLLRRDTKPPGPSVECGHPRPSGVRPPPDPPPGTRSTGHWTVELCGERHAAPNLKGAYRLVLLLLSGRDPEFLDRFAEEGGRGRRFVARAPTQLFQSSPALAEKHAAPLTDGWFFDTNLSTDQVARRVRIAARMCGLHYGTDLRLLKNLEQI